MKKNCLAIVRTLLIYGRTDCVKYYSLWGNPVQAENSPKQSSGSSYADMVKDGLPEKEECALPKSKPMHQH